MRLRFNFIELFGIQIDLEVLVDLAFLNFYRDLSGGFAVDLLEGHHAVLLHVGVWR